MRTTVFLLVLLAGPAMIAACSSSSGQSWRGNFAVHTWIATKERETSTYEVHEVTGWGYEKVRSRPAYSFTHIGH
ncbi:DUF3750 domain-containing protein [Marinobacter sp. F3R11]|uniref:DUF3750 domain-containing protein n=1 Tax=Marinobacter sp. F3R11 TaxID=2267231 RepID=UPI0021C9242A|nr:DUF3750 domain-containing protein [Marinobacter sp. F3R11]